MQGIGESTGDLYPEAREGEINSSSILTACYREAMVKLMRGIEQSQIEEVTAIVKSGRQEVMKAISEAIDSSPFLNELASVRAHSEVTSLLQIKQGRAKTDFFTEEPGIAFIADLLGMEKPSIENAHVKDAEFVAAMSGCLKTLVSSGLKGRSLLSQVEYVLLNAHEHLAHDRNPDPRWASIKERPLISHKGLVILLEAIIGEIASQLGNNSGLNPVIKFELLDAQHGLEEMLAYHVSRDTIVQAPTEMLKRAQNETSQNPTPEVTV